MPLTPEHRLIKVIGSLEIIHQAIQTGSTKTVAINAEAKRIGDAEDMTTAERNAFKKLANECVSAKFWDARERREKK